MKYEDEHKERAYQWYAEQSPDMRNAWDGDCLNLLRIIFDGRVEDEFRERYEAETDTLEKIRNELGEYCHIHTRDAEFRDKLFELIDRAVAVTERDK